MLRSTKRQIPGNQDGAASNALTRTEITTIARLTRSDGSVERVQLTIPQGPIKFLRLPPPGQLCPITGLSRAYLNGLILETAQNNFKPPVRSFVLKGRPDCKRGVRLVEAEDLFRFIREHPASPCQESSKAA